MTRFRRAGTLLLLIALLVGLVPGTVRPVAAQNDPVLFPSPTPTSSLVLPTVTPEPPRVDAAAPADRVFAGAATGVALAPASAAAASAAAASAAAASAAAASAATGPDAARSAAPQTTAALAFVAGELLVGVRESAAPAVAAQANELIAANAGQMGIDAAGVQVIRTFDAGSPTDDLITQVVAVPPGREYDVALLLASVPGVVYVEPNGIVEPAQFSTGPVLPPAAFAINDPLYREQWHNQRVSLSRAWQLAFDSGAFTPQSGQVRVAVLDSGIDAQHPEFAGRMVLNVDYTSPPNVDSCGHGTHVAGLIGAALNNGEGGAGGAPAVQLDIRRVFGASCTGNIGDVAEALRGAADAGADIINLSMQVGSNFETLQLAVEYALGQGALLVAASGNWSSNSLAWPAAYPGVLAVAGLTLDDTRAYYSNRGAGLALAAPGGEAATPVWSTWSRDKIDPQSGDVACVLAPPGGSGAPPATYCGQYGTSQSAAIVSGAAALLLSLDPTLTAAELREILIQSVSPLPQSTNEVGAGKLNVEAAVRSLMPPALVAKTPSLQVESAGAGEPYTHTLRLDVESSRLLTWTASLVFEAPNAASPYTATDAIVLAGADHGTATWGRPVFLVVRVDPTLVDDSLAATVHLNAVDASGVESSRTIPVATLSVWLPIAFDSPSDQWMWSQSIQRAAAPDFAWLEPAVAEDRTLHAMAGVDETPVTLPFAVQVGGDSFSDLVIHADGFVTLPAALPPGVTPGPPADNLCLPATPWPHQAIYGWWADLDPAATGATVSTFALGNRFVIEFSDVPAENVAQPYAVSFQIVLGADGAVQLNYLQAPDFVGRPERATVGVETAQGRFWSEVACSSASAVFRQLPRDGQTLLIAPGEIF